MKVPTLYALLAIGGLGSLFGCQKEQQAHAESRKSQDGPAVVEVTSAESGSLKSSWSFLGQAEPAHQAELASAVEGHVLQVGPREGDRVKKGDVLLQLDSRKARANLLAARAKVSGTEAELAQAERQQARVQSMPPTTVSDPERESFELAVASLRARLEGERAEVQRLQVELSQHTLRAPFDGVLRARKVDPGAWVEGGEGVLELVSLEQLEVHAGVSAEIGSRLSVGQSALLRSPSSDEELGATIEGIVPALSTATRTMRIRMRPDARPAWLLPGLAFEVVFEVDFSGRGVLIPRDALLRGPVETRVVSVVDGHAQMVKVEVLASSGQQLLVRGEGLDEGAQVVVRGNERLKPGQGVEVTQP